MEVVKGKTKEFELLWQSLWRQDDCQHPFYQPFTRRWFREFEPKGKEVEDLSFIIAEEGKPFVGVLIMVYLESQGNHRFSCSGKPILCIENRAENYITMQRAYKFLREEIDKILIKYPNASLIYWDYLYDNEISFLGQYFMEKGACVTPYITQIIGLADIEKELHSKLRKSYKSLINWGRKNLEIKLLDEKIITPEDIEDYRLLHLHAAGRQTRSKRSWDLQYDMVVNREAFMLTGKLDNELVTGVFMLVGQVFCYYGISVSKRELFEKPMSHILLWESIIQAKKRGCKYFELGEQVYPRQANKVSYETYENIFHILSPTEKQLNIAKFKRGFGGETKVRLDIRWERPIIKKEGKEHERSKQSASN